VSPIIAKSGENTIENCIYCISTVILFLRVYIGKGLKRPKWGSAFSPHWRLNKYYLFYLLFFSVFSKY
jgi:hypothetical protein